MVAFVFCDCVLSTWFVCLCTTCLVVLFYVVWFLVWLPLLGLTFRRSEGCVHLLQMCCGVF